MNPSKTRKISDLEKENAALKQALKKINEREEKFKAFFDNASDVLVYLDNDGRMTEINNAVMEVFGYEHKEVTGKMFSDFNILSQDTVEKLNEAIRHAAFGNTVPRMEFEALRKDGTRIFVEVTSRTLQKNNDDICYICIVRDITDRKMMEQKLQDHQDHLEELVTERTVKFEETNAALKVLLKRREDDRAELEEKILHNVKEMIIPHLEKVNTGKMNYKQKVNLEIIQENLNDITSPFSHRLSSKYFNFTPSELQIANYIKYGRTTKDIAEILNLSVNTILFHRSNIRKKLGITKQKSNLRSYLQFLNK